MQQVKYQSVAVITSTIGREQLIRAIESVKAQTYPCKHYVFVDGEQFSESAKKILDQYPDVIATYLPMNTGANGWTNSSINAIAPFLTKEDVICYLDDDNWYEPNHVESCLNRLNETGADYVFAMRNLYTPNNEFICEDLSESLGLFENKINYPITITLTYNEQEFELQHTINKKQHIDTNCYFIPRNIATSLASHWYTGLHNDTNVFAAITAMNLTGESNQQFSVNYLFDIEKQVPSLFEISEKIGFTKEQAIQMYYQLLSQLSQRQFSLYGNKYPWQ